MFRTVFGAKTSSLHSAPRRYSGEPVYSWSKEFLEAGKKRLAGDTARSASGDEVKALCREIRDLKEVLADVTRENRPLKKNIIGDGDDDE